MCKSNEIILDIVTAGSRYHSASHHANVERGRGKVFCVSGILRVGGGSSLPAGGWGMNPAGEIHCMFSPFTALIKGDP